MIILGVKYLLRFKLLNRKYIFYLLAAMLMFAVCWGIRMSDLTDFATIIISSIVGVVVYAGMLYLGKDPFAMEFAAVIRAKLSEINIAECPDGTIIWLLAPVYSAQRLPIRPNKLVSGALSLTSVPILEVISIVKILKV